VRRTRPVRPVKTCSSSFFREYVLGLKELFVASNVPSTPFHLSRCQPDLKGMYSPLGTLFLVEQAIASALDSPRVFFSGPTRLCPILIIPLGLVERTLFPRVRSGSWFGG